MSRYNWMRQKWYCDGCGRLHGPDVWIGGVRGHRKYCDRTAPVLETEQTDAGEQTLVPGVQPVTDKQRLERLAKSPMRGKREQKPCTAGLFNDDQQAQVDLMDLL